MSQSNGQGTPNFSAPQSMGAPGTPNLPPGINPQMIQQLAAQYPNSFLAQRMPQGVQAPRYNAGFPGMSAAFPNWTPGMFGGPQGNAQGSVNGTPPATPAGSGTAIHPMVAQALANMLGQNANSNAQIPFTPGVGPLGFQDRFSNR